VTISLGIVLAYFNTLGKRSSAEKILLITLIHSLGDNPNNLVEGSAKVMGKAMGMSPRSFQRHIYHLKKRGILTVKNTMDYSDSKFQGRIGANQYGLPGWIEFVKKWNEVHPEIEC